MPDQPHGKGHERQGAPPSQWPSANETAYGGKEPPAAEAAQAAEEEATGEHAGGPAGEEPSGQEPPQSGRRRT